MRRVLEPPQAQLRLTDPDGHRYSAFATNTAPGGPHRQLADLELRHRRRARVEDPIRAARTPACATSRCTTWTRTASGAPSPRSPASSPPEHADLIVLDLGLPDIDGTAVITALRATSTMPIIVLSARIDAPDKVRALDTGADDYVTKPFGIAALLARMRAATRRADLSSDPSDGDTSRTDQILVQTPAFTIDLAAKRSPDTARTYG
jgi:CheY-like chemotaxis protein